MEHSVDLTDVPGNVALLGVAGSHAFGMARPGSDVDYRGCYVAPTRALFGLRLPPDSYSHKDPDVAMHEVGTFVRYAAAANPTALEALHYSEYVIKDHIGDLLLAKRGLFITDKIRDTHLGFAESQFKRLTKRLDSFSSKTAKRTEKHARHTLRVIRLTEKALTTGVYDLVVDDPEEIFAFGELDHDEMSRRAAVEITRIRSLKSVLPHGPDFKAINDLLVNIRELGLL